MSPVQNQFPELFCQLASGIITHGRGNPWLHVVVSLLECKVKHRALYVSLGSREMEWTASPATHRTGRNMFAAAAGRARWEGSFDPIFSSGNMK